jgi:autotransporter-associated beta strand protein
MIFDEGNAAFANPQNFVINGNGTGDGPNTDNGIASLGNDSALQAISVNFGSVTTGGLDIATSSTVRVNTNLTPSAPNLGIQVNGPLAGAGALTLIGATGDTFNDGYNNTIVGGYGTLILNETAGPITGVAGSAAFTGNVNVNDGVLETTTFSNAMGPNTSTSQTVTVASGAAVVFNNTGVPSVSNPQNFVINGTGTGDGTAGALGANASLQAIGANSIGGLAIQSSSAISTSGILQVNGALAGTSGDSDTLSGGGTLILKQAAASVAGVGAYSGTLTVSGGTTLDLSNASGSAMGTGNVVLSGGSLTSDSGSMTGNVTSTGAVNTIAPGGVGSIGTLSLGGLTTDNQTTLNFDLGTGSGTITNGDLLILGSGTISIGSGTAITFGTDPGVSAVGNDYELIGGTISGISTGSFTLPTAPGVTYGLSKIGGFIDLVVNGTGPANLTWNNTGAGSPTDGVTWDTTHINWNNGSGPTTYSDGTNVTFNDTNNSHYAVTLNTTVMPGSVTISTNATSAPTYTISGTGKIAGTSSLTKTGTGIATIATPNTYTGGTFVNGGTLVIAPTTTANAVALPDGAVSIGAAGKLQLADNASASSPFVNSATDISNQLMKLSSLSITTGGKLDIRNNHFYVADTGVGAHPDDATYTSILGLVKNGAITSSEGLSGYGVGIVDGNDSVLGTPVSVNQIEVAYTLEGDANLDGKVDITDFNIFAPNFGLPTTLGWEAGDFDYSGTVDIGDFNLFAGNFGLSDNGTAVSMPAADYAALDSFEAANGLTLTSVPEPASLGLLTLGAVGILVRRRRRCPQE